MMLALFLYAEDAFDASADVEMAWMRSAYRWASFVLATPVMFLAGGPLLRSAQKQLVQRRLSMDALIAMGAFAAYLLSVDALARGRHALYFDAATASVVLATFGRWLEATARSKASRALGPLLEVSRGTVRQERDGAESALIAAHEVEPGMRIVLDAGQVVPVDLRLEQDKAEFDLAVLSGESRPVVVLRGTTVPAGAVTVTPSVRGTAQRASRDSALERLASLARSLGEKRARTLAWADRFATVLTPLIAVVATITVVYWTRADSLDKGIIAGLSVVLAACPCSYVIAAPLVHWVTLKTAFRRGVLIRSTETLEELARVAIVAFDKTGTLTHSQLSIGCERIAPSADRNEVLALLRALEDENAHPIGRALFAYAAGADERVHLPERRFVAGRGVEAVDEMGRKLALHAGDDGSIVLERDGEILAAFVIHEQLRPEAREAIEMLREAGLQAVVLSGDAEERVSHVRDALAVRAEAHLSPEEKVRALEALGAHAAMVGDGINDAPALAAGRATFTLASAAQLAKGVAGVTLLTADLRLVASTLALARRGMRLAKGLIFSSTAYNVLFVGLAAAGALKPVWAGVSMMLSSLLAVGFAAAMGSDETDHEVRGFAASSPAC
jgi:Cu2+-exporting ATPase